MSEIYQQLMHYGAALWRKRGYIALIGWLLCVPGWIGVMALPDRYESQARIYVDTDSLLAPLLRGLSVEGNIGQQVDFMQRTLLSRPNMEKLVRMTDLDLRITNQIEKDALFIDVAKRVQIVQNQSRNLFSVSFADRSPELAQRVVQSLLSIFVESSVGASRSDIEKARQFLDVQIAQYEKQLQAAEARLAEFKTSHLEILSRAGANGSFQQSLDQARTIQAELKGQFQEALSKREVLRRQVETVPQFLQVDSQPQVVVQNGERLPAALASINQHIQEQETKINELAIRFTEKHPDLIAAKRQLETMKQQYDEAEKKLKTTAGDKVEPTRTAKSSVPNPVYEQVKLKLVDTESVLSTVERHLQMVSEEVVKFEDLAKTAPTVEAQLSTLNRDYGVLHKSYDELLSRREAARLADAVETTGDKIQFRIVDPPQIASVPSGPPRLILMSAILFGSLAAGIAVAFLMSQLDDTFSSIARLRESIALPVLGSVSLILTPIDRRMRAIRTLGFAASIGALVVTYGGLSLALLRGFLLPIT